jgi:hypothetical protein
MVDRKRRKRRIIEGLKKISKDGRGINRKGKKKEGKLIKP